jgi:hypothetical protein
MDQCSAAQHPISAPGLAAVVTLVFEHPLRGNCLCMTARDGARGRTAQATPHRRRANGADSASNAPVPQSDRPRRRRPTSPPSKRTVATRVSPPDAVGPRTSAGAVTDSDAPSNEADVEALKAAVYRLLDTLLARGSLVAGQFREWMDTLFEAVEQHSAGVRAGVEGLKAVLAGENPVKAAIKGLWMGLSGAAKTAIVLLVVLGLLLAPVLLVILLLTLLVVALIAAVRAGSQ